MGFGYNPDLYRYGERIDMLYYFAWMLKLQKELDIQWTIYDASGYAIVNQARDKNILKANGEPKTIINTIINEGNRPCKEYFRRNCDLRSNYLKRLIKISKLEANYIDSRVIFREDGDYVEAFSIAYNFVEKNKDSSRFVKEVNKRSNNLSKKLYLPLEIAEAIYLYNKESIDIKFGPETEKYFDEGILGIMKQDSINYSSLLCPLGPRKPGYLSDENVLWSKMRIDLIVQTLSEDDNYKEFVSSYMSIFRKGVPLEETVSIASRLMEVGR